MPAPSFRYRIDTDHGLALAQIAGDATGEYIASCVRALQADPAWSDAYDVIWDDRGVTVLDVTPRGLDEMVAAQTNGQFGMDVIVSDRGSREAVFLLYARRTRAAGRPARVCRTLDEALAAVGRTALPAALDVA
ncbi:hypothetical protein [Rubrivirga litoralis]|uniref:Uncharacterized protein n=1 Tax=Rubrivirga litoralis TaxID=3075598 RepID=A0ABU3BMX1_9BACT|nr:hypothetical protein [Rubrivirga sp. F394]MDT0630633.1 hypothetical protein [Rubrivirga sp. F394]